VAVNLAVKCRDHSVCASVEEVEQVEIFRKCRGKKPVRRIYDEKNRNENRMVLNPKTPVYVNGMNRYTERGISLVEVDRLRTEKVKEDAEVS
jgi:hypothetical protein